MAEKRIMYVCSDCADWAPEQCGYYDRDDLREMPDGKWFCSACFDNADRTNDDRCWSDYPLPPEYGPSTPPHVRQGDT